MKLEFGKIEIPRGVKPEQWHDWQWQFRNMLRTEIDFEKYFSLTDEERLAFRQGKSLFNIRTSPYYAKLCGPDLQDPLRRMVVPTAAELSMGIGDLADPLGERRNNPAPRIIHRYPDRALLLVTDHCGVYCRYCTRKHFTGQDQALVKNDEYQQALAYLQAKPGIREVILSGGDPLTLSDSNLDRILFDLRKIDHVEIIRIGSRIPAACPMRVTPELVGIFKKHKPVYLMSHFNHPRELTVESARALESLVDHGIPVMNQMVILNGINNHEAIIQALSRRLVFLRVKPYYAFQCDPSPGTEHLRISVEEFRQLQKKLWGTLSGLAMPVFAVDIPDGGGKAGVVPDFEIERKPEYSTYQGWDGVKSTYHAPDPKYRTLPWDFEKYLPEWEVTKSARG